MTFFRSVVFLIISVILIIPASAEDLEKKYRDIQNQIKEQKIKLKKIKEKESSFIAQIDIANRSLELNKKALSIQKQKLSNTRGRINVVKNDIASFNKLLDKQRSYLRRKLSSVQRYGNEAANTLAVIASSNSFSQMVRNMHFLKKIAEYDFAQIQEYKENLIKLDEKKKDLNTLYSAQKEEEKELKLREQELKAEKNRKEYLLAAVRKQKEGYRKMLKELTDASNSVRKMLEEKNANTYKLTRFALLKGKLPWPITNGIVAKKYGQYEDPEFKTPVFRRGVYIKAQEGAPAKAIYTGKVVYADWFKGYGKVIIINHGGGYHSVYANLNEIYFKAGDIVKRQQPIGEVGQSGTISAPALYFEIRFKGKPLNPNQWLDRG
ncbi:MAG: peptidoglycan DD-metalloendopeptidase family protein [Nitrospirota bacterium]|nr:MAG: peptidoglycan DD-metalloendopeptidase family protein [Nitrospirota bacterium]